MKALKVFVPFSEALSPQMIEALGLSSTDLVPFQLDYPCVQMQLGESAEAEAEVEAEAPVALDS